MSWFMIGFIVAVLVTRVLLLRLRAPSLGHMPTIMHSRGGYESHLDFLEMHGFISEEEREFQRNIQREFKEHPERFKVVTLKELLARREETGE
jgi:hypothetical protein